MESYVYDGSVESLRKVFELRNQGVAILCPACGAALIVALDYEAANRHRVHTGIYCPGNRRHVFELIELRTP